VHILAQLQKNEDERKKADVEAKVKIHLEKHKEEHYPTKAPTGMFTLKSILIVLDCLLIVNVKFIISLKLP
jgi:hypothetical protein